MQNTTTAIEEHYEQLMRDGVAVIRAGFDDDRIQRLREDFNRFVDLNSEIFEPHRDSDGHFPRIINLHLGFQNLMDLFCDNEVALGVQDKFFGATSSVYTTLYYERGSAQDIHRDSPYFCTRPEGNYLGVWVALEDAGEENGCLEVIKKGHLLPELNREELATKLFGSLNKVPAASDELWGLYQGELKQQYEQAGLAPELIRVNAGDTVIWHPQLPHGGSHINDINRTRHSLVMHVTPVGMPVYHQDVFFNPDKKVATRAPWKYGQYKNRQFAQHGQIEFGHQDPRPPSAFKQLTA